MELTFMLPPDFPAGGGSERSRHLDGVERTGSRHAARWPCGQGHRRLLPGRAVQCGERPLRNRQLLKERSWFDIPLVYSNQRRAIIAIEKGSPGERAFNDAFAAWGG
ncbi:MAG: hypothetical protein MZV49_02220 [Rhodopseudomonas palustris]|nr:hypothetical protein [Rhodopseudomonas palustris]